MSLAGCSCRRRKQEDDRLALPMKVNAVAGTVVDPEFADPSPTGSNIAGMAKGEPIETGGDRGPRASSRNRARHLRKVSV